MITLNSFRDINVIRGFSPFRLSRILFLPRRVGSGGSQNELFLFLPLHVRRISSHFKLFLFLSLHFPKEIITFQPFVALVLRRGGLVENNVLIIPLEMAPKPQYFLLKKQAPSHH
jgi:hypothetical protein